jgi:hypothetical protein
MYKKFSQKLPFQMQRVGFGFSVRPGWGTLTRSNRLGADMTYLKLKTLDEYFDVCVQCNLDLATLNLVTTCDLVTVLQRHFFQFTILKYNHSI